MKVIFLDIDGVLNTSRSTTTKKAVIVNMGDHTVGFNRFEPGCVERLNEITDATGAKFVISSTWRIGCKLNGTLELLYKHLKNEGVTGEVIDVTPLDKECGYINELFPSGSHGVRGLEIQKWLNDNHGKYSIEKFIMLDDSSDMYHLMSYLVYIKNGWMGGIQPEHVEESIKRLGAMV